MVGRMDGTILPTTQGIKFIRRIRFWKRESSLRVSLSTYHQSA